jgi:hypothetical protein
MQIDSTLRLLVGYFALMVLSTLSVQAEEKQSITFLPPVLEDNTLSLQWWANSLSGQTIKNAELLVDNTAITSQVALEPNRGQAVCYMLMVDSSQSMKEHFSNNSVKQLLGSLIDRKPDKHYLGLALFAEKWQLLSKPIQDKATLKASLNKIEPVGTLTELFRFTEEAPKSLNGCPPDSYRKVLIMLTDGDAEDEAFTLNSATQAALTNKLGIYAFGFQNSGAKKADYQNPLRMAESTGGVFVYPTEYAGQKRDAAVDAFYVGSNSGGNLQATVPQLNANQKVNLRITLANGQTLTQSVPLSLEPIADMPAWKQQIIVSVPGLDAKKLNYLLWGMGILLLSLLIWLIYRTLRSAPVVTEPPRSPVGFVVHQGQPYPIFPGINSIGSLPTNNIAIDDDTVSRTHATLHYQGDGDVMLTDLGSLNHCWVNGSLIQRPTSVHDGDTIAFGEWQAIYQRAQ